MGCRPSSRPWHTPVCAMVGYTLCHVCNKTLQARSLCQHLTDVHKIHQQVVVPEALLEEQTDVCYKAGTGGKKDSIKCPFSGCVGVLSSLYMLRWHFRDLHLKDNAEISKEGPFPQCKRCTMQWNPLYLRLTQAGPWTVPSANLTRFPDEGKQ